MSSGRARLHADFTLAVPRLMGKREPRVIGLPRGADWRNRASVYHPPPNGEYLESFGIQKATLTTGADWAQTERQV